MASAVERRLKEREEARRIALEQSKLDKEGEKKEEETQEYFYAHFSELKQEIEDMLSVTSTQSDFKQHFDQIGVKFQSLQKLLSDSAMYLPRYNLRTSQEKVTELKNTIQAKQDEFLPRKKFAFNSRKKTTSSSQPQSAKPTESAIVKPTTVKSTSTTTRAHNTMDIRDKSSTSFTLTPSEGYDVCLTNIDSCTVNITGCPGTIHISNIRNTRLLCGPVKGSVFIEDCSECHIAIACQQLRIHSTTNTDFYLHVTSKAIIEDSNTVRFAPYTVTYPEISSHYQCSGLSTDVNNWDQVDDFNWLTSKEHSPNWSILPEESRTKDWTLT